MNIAGMQKLTVQDYPNHLAALIFTQGCNLNCSYCQNSQLIEKPKETTLNPEEVLNYLQKRRNVLDGIAISGGEPLMQPGLIDFIKKVKNLKFKVKIDTNGLFPEIIKKLIDNDLVDYLAVDIKNDFNNYDKVSGVRKANIDKIKKSIEIINSSEVEHEYRTTIVKNFHTIENIYRIADYLGPKQKYYLQNFEDSEFVRDKNLKSFTKEELVEWQKKLKEKYPNVKIRGI